MIIRRANERGHFDHGWLKTWHTFSFADYEDEKWMGFTDLRVINEDTVAPGEGFGRHGHRDMEIITFVLEGALRHTDSMGSSGVIAPGDVQRMSAGTGVLHSEMNASTVVPGHLYQVWIMPEKQGVAPSYEQKPFSDRIENESRLLLVSPDARDGSLKIHQRCEVWHWKLTAGEKTDITLAKGQSAWIQVVSGAILVNGQELLTSDAAGLEVSATVEAVSPSRLLIFIFG